MAWLTVDHDDNNVVWFLSHLIEAIRAVTPALATELGEVLEEHGDEAERYVLTSLINEIHEAGTRMTLVIDDWQRVTDPATIAALNYLLVYASEDLNVIVTSRSQSGLPMSRMRMQDELLEIDATALRFDVAESENFLVDLEWAGPRPRRRRGTHRQDRRLGGRTAAGIVVAARPRRP